MGTGIGQRDGGLLYKMIKDLKANKSAYVKNNITVKEMQAIDPRVKAKYDKEENEYLLTYDFKQGEVERAIY